MAAIKSKEYFKNDLTELSYCLGNNLDWVQGAGGNTSVKIKEILWVKASGYWLSDSRSEIFVPLNRQAVLDKIALGEEDLSSTRIVSNKNEHLRPSIETTLHALMPHKFVAHIHSVNVISYAVLENCKQLLNQHLGELKWLWIPYVRPGLPLTLKMNDTNLRNYDVIILANHGLVVGAESKNGIMSLINEVEKKLSRPLRKIASSAQIEKIIDSCNISNYKLPKYDFCHNLAKDNFSINVLSNNALYPDHVIFIGPEKIPVMSFESFKFNSLKKSLNTEHMVIVIKDFGVLVNKSISLNAEELLHCLTNVLLRLDPRDKLQYLKDNEEAELLGWDAEKYRKLIKK